MAILGPQSFFSDLFSHNDLFPFTPLGLSWPANLGRNQIHFLVFLLGFLAFKTPEPFA